MAGKHSVAIRVLGQEYRIRTDAAPAELQRVASFVDETMSRLRGRTGAVDSLDLAVMAAVNLARDLLAERAGRRSEGVAIQRVRALTDEVEALLRETDVARG
jgi:cell division protein ZapA (FtsZ GTPase activity inhibitor)